MHKELKIGNCDSKIAFSPVIFYKDQEKEKIQKQSDYNCLEISSTEAWISVAVTLRNNLCVDVLPIKQD